MRDEDSADGNIETVLDRLRNGSLESRRGFLRRSAAAGGSVLALAWVGSNTALADDVNVDDAKTVEVLQFALTLEHLENAFYRDVGGRFDEVDYRRARSLRGFGNRVRGSVHENIQDIADHERIHVNTLESVISNNFNADPVDEANYDFGVDSVDEFLTVARILENTGVSAYDGSLADIDTAEYATAGATIATTEARHASYLNLLTGVDPFPSAFDTAKSREEILDAAGQFFA